MTSFTVLCVLSIALLCGRSRSSRGGLEQMALEAESGMLEVQQEAQAVDVDALVAVSVVLAIASTTLQGFVALFKGYKCSITESNIDAMDENQLTEFQELSRDMQRIKGLYEDLVYRIKESIVPVQFMNAEKIHQFTNKMNIATRIRAFPDVETTEKELNGFLEGKTEAEMVDSTTKWAFRRIYNLYNLKETIKGHIVDVFEVCNLLFLIFTSGVSPDDTDVLHPVVALIVENFGSEVHQIARIISVSLSLLITFKRACETYTSYTGISRFDTDMLTMKAMSSEYTKSRFVLPICRFQQKVYDDLKSFKKKKTGFQNLITESNQIVDTEYNRALDDYENLFRQYFLKQEEIDHSCNDVGCDVFLSNQETYAQQHQKDITALENLKVKKEAADEYRKNILSKKKKSTENPFQSTAVEIAQLKAAIRASWSRHCSKYFLPPDRRKDSAVVEIGFRRDFYFDHIIPANLGGKQVEMVPNTKRLGPLVAGQRFNAFKLLVSRKDNLESHELPLIVSHLHLDMIDKADRVIGNRISSPAGFELLKCNTDTNISRSFLEIIFDRMEGCLGAACASNVKDGVDSAYHQITGMRLDDPKATFYPDNLLARPGTLVQFVQDQLLQMWPSNAAFLHVEKTLYKKANQAVKAIGVSQYDITTRHWASGLGPNCLQDQLCSNRNLLKIAFSERYGCVWYPIDHRPLFPEAESRDYAKSYFIWVCIATTLKCPRGSTSEGWCSQSDMEVVDSWDPRENEIDSEEKIMNEDSQFEVESMRETVSRASSSNVLERSSIKKDSSDSIGISRDLDSGRYLSASTGLGRLFTPKYFLGAADKSSLVVKDPGSGLISHELNYDDVFSKISDIENAGNSNQLRSEALITNDEPFIRNSMFSTTQRKRIDSYTPSIRSTLQRRIDPNYSSPTPSDPFAPRIDSETLPRHLQSEFA